MVSAAYEGLEPLLREFADLLGPENSKLPTGTGNCRHLNELVRERWALQSNEQAAHCAWLLVNEAASVDGDPTQDEQPLLAARFLLAIEPLPSKLDDQIPGTAWTVGKALAELRPSATWRRLNVSSSSTQRQFLAAATNSQDRTRTTWSPKGSGTVAAARALHEEVLRLLDDHEVRDRILGDWEAELASQHGTPQPMASREPARRAREVLMEELGDFGSLRDLTFEKLRLQAPQTTELLGADATAVQRLETIYARLDWLLGNVWAVRAGEEPSARSSRFGPNLADRGVVVADEIARGSASTALLSLGIEGLSDDEFIIRLGFAADVSMESPVITRTDYPLGHPWRDRPDPDVSTLPMGDDTDYNGVQVRVRDLRITQTYYRDRRAEVTVVNVEWRGSEVPAVRISDGFLGGRLPHVQVHLPAPGMVSIYLLWPQ